MKKLIEQRLEQESKKEQIKNTCKNLDDFLDDVEVKSKIKVNFNELNAILKKNIKSVKTLLK